MSWLVFGGTTLVIVAAGWLVIRRYRRWSDPSLDTEAKQAEAQLWSKRIGSGGFGS